MSLSTECNLSSLGGLPDIHCIDEQLQRGEIPILDEFYRSMVLKMPIGRVEKDAGIGFIAGIKIHECDPNPVYPAQLALEAAGVGMFTDTRSLAANGFRDHSYRDMQFMRDTRGVQTACLRI